MPAQAPGAGHARRTGDAAALRPSDADRDRVLAEPRDRYAEGRLSHETFVHRVDAVLRAKRQADLDGQLADLPCRQHIAARFRASGVATAGHRPAVAGRGRAAERCHHRAPGG